MVGHSAITKPLATMEHLRTCFPELPLGLSGKAEASSVGRAAPGSLLLVESPLSASLFCGGQCTRCGLFFPCHQRTLCGLFDKKGDGLWLRHIDGVAAFDLHNR